MMAAMALSGLKLTCSRQQARAGSDSWCWACPVATGWLGSWLLGHGAACVHVWGARARQALQQQHGSVPMPVQQELCTCSSFQCWHVVLSPLVAG
jgi:hypothetical protein